MGRFWHGLGYDRATVVHSRRVRREQILSGIEAVKPKLGPAVIDVSYRLGYDWAGDPSIFFRVILADWATAESTLAEITGRIVTTLSDEIEPLENWGFHPYVNFGSQANNKQ